MDHTIQNQTKPNLAIPNQTKFPYIGHKSVVFQNRISKFGMELHLDNIQYPISSTTRLTHHNHEDNNNDDNDLDGDKFF